MKTKITRRFLLTGLVLLGSVASSSAAQVYLETFTSSPNPSMSGAGWSALLTEDTLASEDNLTSDYGTQSRAMGVTTTATGIAYYAPQQDDSNGPGGIPVANFRVDNDPALAYTTEPITINITDLTSISWDANGDNPDHAYRVAIQVGGQWYASSTALNHGTPYERGASGTYTGLSYAPTSFATAANWLAIQNTTIGVTGPLSLGSAPGADLTGDVSAYGLYLVAGALSEPAVPATDPLGDHIRWDNFAINAVPEPSAALLGGLGLLALLRRRR